MKSHNFFEKKFAMCVASLVFGNRIKCVIFENLSTTKNMDHFPFLSLENPTQNPCLFHPKAYME
jgi:hypothetical protein